MRVKDDSRLTARASAATVTTTPMITDVSKVRARANRAFAETIVVETNGHGNGHEVGNGHGAAVEAGQAGEQASVGSAAAGQLPAGENPADSPGSGI